jgi:hypothetical protein
MATTGQAEDESTSGSGGSEGALQSTFMIRHDAIDAVASMRELLAVPQWNKKAIHFCVLAEYDTVQCSHNAGEGMSGSF